MTYLTYFQKTKISTDSSWIPRENIQYFHKDIFSSEKCIQPGIVVPACDPWYLGGWKVQGQLALHSIVQGQPEVYSEYLSKKIPKAKYRQNRGNFLGLLCSFYLLLVMGSEWGILWDCYPWFISSKKKYVKLYQRPSSAKRRVLEWEWKSTYTTSFTSQFLSRLTFSKFTNITLQCPVPRSPAVDKTRYRSGPQLLRDKHRG